MLTAVLIMTTQLATEPPMTVTTSSFQDHAAIPKEHTCQGKDQSWSLSITGVPKEAKSLAVVVHDPDAPDPKAPRPGGWTHWVLYDLPPSTTELAAGVSAAALPHGTLQGRNDWKKPGFRGPCPPVGRHRYVTTVYAVDTVLGDLKEPPREALLKAMDGHVVAKAELTGTYQK